MEEIYLPLEIIRNSPGFAFDIGCTIGKLIYRPNSLYKNGEIIAEDKIQNLLYDHATNYNGVKILLNNLGPLFLRSFKRGDAEDLTKIIKEECDISLEQGEICVTGVGTGSVKYLMEEHFNIKWNVVGEFDLAVDAISFWFENLGPKRIFLPEQPGAREEAVRRFKIYQTWIKARKTMSRVVWEQEQNQEEALAWQPDTTGDIYPYLLIVCGSLFSINIVQKDGSIHCPMFQRMGGRFVYGLLATLTGEKDFEKLIAMAEESDGRTTDIYAEELRTLDLNLDPKAKEHHGTDKQGDAYSFIKGDLIAFPFGKPATSDGEVKNGDMVHSVLDAVCMNLAFLAHTTATAYECKHIFFAGNFVSPALIREWLTREMIKKNLESPMEKRMNFQFIRHGGHLSCVGAFIKGAKKQSTETS